MIEAASRATQSEKLIESDPLSQKKLKNLFYIKSKHTKYNYKNHPYFKTTTDVNPISEKLSESLEKSNKPPKRSLINERRLKTQSHNEIQNSNNFNNEFVNYPTQYGLQNTYNYLRSKSFIAKFQSQSSRKSNHNLSRKSPSPQRKILTEGNEENSNDKNYMKITASYQSKFYNTVKTEQNQKIRSLSGYNQKFPTGFESKFRRKPLPIFKLIEKRNSVSISNQPQLSESKVSESITGVNRNVIYNTPILKNSSTKNSAHLTSAPASHKIQFIYSKRLKSIAQIPYRTITFDIFPSIVTTFLKCKIHYNQMTQHEYDFVHEAMVKAVQSKKKPERYDIKDIINIGSIKEVMKFLSQFKGQQTDFEWIETIRYFFLLKDQKVLDYHMNKIKEEVARLIAIKFDVEFGQKDVFVYDLEKKTQVLTIYDLIQGQKFLISDSDKVLADYISMKNQQFQKQTLQNKIQKWKSIADCSPSVSENGDGLQSSKASKTDLKSRKDPETPVLGPTKKLSQEKFKDIFEQFKIRQKKRLSKHFSSGTNTVSHSLQSSFIQRSKLKREQDFFE